MSGPAVLPKPAAGPAQPLALDVGLRAEGLVKAYHGRRVVDGVSFAVGPGEIAGLLGPNGAGKTTSFYMVIGVIVQDGGRVFLDGDDITRRPMYRRAQAGITYLPQEASIFRGLTVEENLMAVAQSLPIPRKERKARVDKFMEELGVAHLADHKALTLSGGERRRVEIARSLVMNPKFILMDEPFAGVDPIAVADIQRIVRDLSVRRIGVLITDHNVRETLSICDHATIIHEGRVMISGRPEEIVASPLARKHYLGDNFELATGRRGEETQDD
jgi:lipopolysaccharide export system ATP-binding protein